MNKTPAARQVFRTAGIMGWPISHSRSPLLHGHWLARYGLPGAYIPLPVAPEALPRALEGLAALGFAGCNVTIPHKVAVIPYLHHVDPMARKMGAVNTIVVDSDGQLCGYNNDGYGYIQCLLDAFPDWRADIGPIAVIGAGGAARAVVVSLAERGATEIRVVNRSLDKSQALARDVGVPAKAFPWQDRHDLLDGAALLVNATSQGMKGQSALDLSLNRLPRHALVSDVVYTPLDTPLLATARARGHATVNGMGMLLNQARPAFETWFGVRPNITSELRNMMSADL
ncbi:MAG: shikimate dehydrogenase [Rhodoferax sp.]|nr:shikimate dehydrogenase [Rhodoferax sp.]